MSSDNCETECSVRVKVLLEDGQFKYGGQTVNSNCIPCTDMDAERFSFEVTVFVQSWYQSPSCKEDMLSKRSTCQCLSSGIVMPCGLESS
jgi:hypothetical protein